MLGTVLPPRLWGELEQDPISFGESAVSLSVPGEIVEPARELGL